MHTAHAYMHCIHVLVYMVGTHVHACYKLCCRVVLLVVAIARFFGVEKEVREGLADSKEKEAIRVEQYICDRLRSALDVLKHCARITSGKQGQKGI